MVAKMNGMCKYSKDGVGWILINHKLIFQLAAQYIIILYASYGNEDSVLALVNQYLIQKHLRCKKGAAK